MRVSYSLKLVVLSLIGLIAALWQAVERVNMLKDPSVPLACNINPVIDCGTILNHPLASLFGFPNAFIGIIMFSLLLSFGIVTLLDSDTKRAQHFLLTVATIVLLFSIWFFGVSVYLIGKICIFCIFIWLVSIPIYVYTLREYLNNKGSLQGLLVTIRSVIDKHALATTLIIYTTLLLLFLYRFRDYYFG